MSNGKLFLGGRPTGPDVRRLMDKYKDTTNGDQISLEEIATEIGLDIRDTRFRTVIDKFRKTLRKERNLVTDRPHGEGVLVVLQENQREGNGLGRIRQGMRKIIRAHVDIADTDVSKLKTTEERDRLMRTKRLTEKLAHDGRTSVNEIVSHLAPPRQLPRAQAIK